MSVLKSKRTESKAQFVTTANQIYAETLHFIARLSGRYRFLIGGNAMQLASGVVNNAEMANSIFPSDSIRKELREKHLLEARASLMALDVQMAHVYSILSQNPCGCFEKTSGEPLPTDRARDKLNKMAESLGCLIDEENALLTKVLKSDKKR